MYTELKKKKKCLAEKEEENSGCGKQKQNVCIKTTQAEDPLLKKTVALSEKGTHNYNTTEFVINQQIRTEVIKSHLRVNNPCSLTAREHLISAASTWDRPLATYILYQTKQEKKPFMTFFLQEV